MIVCGVDEAGRGSVLGPLVVAGISIERSKIKHLSEIGIKDSKQLSPFTRMKLYKKIISLVDEYKIAKISPHIIDKNVSKNRLNDLEGKYMAMIIGKLRPDSAYVDSCDVNSRRFGEKIAKLSKIKKVYSSHHADRRFPVVSAASILAKVSRDRAVERLRKHYDLGSGYPSDVKTMSFIKKYIELHGSPPQFVRKSWRPVRAMLCSV